MQKPTTISAATLWFALALAAPALKATTYVPHRLTMPSTRMVGFDLNGAANLISQVQAASDTALLPPPPVTKPPVRKLYFRPRPRTISQR
jgi:hypothetical protein